VFTWTEEKNQLNKQRHGLFLSEIVDVFEDPHLKERQHSFNNSTESHRKREKVI